MGILQDIADGKPIQNKGPVKATLVPAELVETFAQIQQSTEAHLAASQENLQVLRELKANSDAKIADCDTNIARLEAAIAARKAQEGPPKAARNTPPVLRPTAPLGYLMNERTKKREMEDGTWDINITIETLNIDDLVYPDDFANQVAYENHKAHVLKSTPEGMFPGFRIKAKCGLLNSSKRVIKPCISKEDVMYSKEFLVNLSRIFSLMKSKSGLPD